MKSIRIGLRLRPDEIAMLDRIRPSDELGDMNRSEILRLLIHREYARRTTGRSVVQSPAIATDFRTGRPKGTVATEAVASDGGGR